MNDLYSAQQTPQTSSALPPTISKMTAPTLDELAANVQELSHSNLVNCGIGMGLF